MVIEASIVCNFSRRIRGSHLNRQPALSASDLAAKSVHIAKSGYDPTLQSTTACHVKVCLIGWMSDTLSQTYTDLQSLVKCLDHGGIVLVLDTVCSQARAVLGRAMH